MIIFGLMVQSYGNNNLVIRFIFIWLSGFGLLKLRSKIQVLRFLPTLPLLGRGMPP